MITPSIDLMNGKVVVLENGKKELLNFAGPLKIAQKFNMYPLIQIIDLDAAMNKGNNQKIINLLLKKYNVRVGGGIRSIDKAKEMISLGAKEVIIGTNANKNFLKQLCNEIGKEKIIVAVDGKNGFVETNGWQEKTNEVIIEKTKELSNYCSGFLYTNTSLDGTGKGIDIKTAKSIKKVTKNKVIVAGGANSIKDINLAQKNNLDIVIGKAFYDKTLDPTKTFLTTIDFEKGNNLVPTIIQEENGKVISLVYSNKESVAKTIKTKKAWLYSRSRNKVVQKGATSGNVQEILDIKTDCDNDALLYTVKQRGPCGCHTGSYTCFGEEKEFSLQELYNKISQRISEGKKDSYTQKLVNDELLLKRKLVEEAAEVITAKDKQNLIWECSDLIYFLFVIMNKEGISIKDIEKENERRDKK